MSTGLNAKKQLKDYQVMGRWLCQTWGGRIIQDPRSMATLHKMFCVLDYLVPCFFKRPVMKHSHCSTYLIVSIVFFTVLLAKSSFPTTVFFATPCAVHAQKPSKCLFAVRHSKHPHWCLQASDQVIQLHSQVVEDLFQHSTCS